MRVIHVITRLIVGGAQENTVATVLGLRKKPGVEASLIAGPSIGPEGSLGEVLSGMSIHPDVLPELVRPVHPWKDLLAWRKLTRIFRQQQPDIVHTHSGKAGVVGRLAARKAGVPIVIHTIHGPSFGSFQGAVANLIFRTAEKRAALATTHFIVVANAMARQYLQAGIGSEEQYTRILSGFNLEPFLNARNDVEQRRKLGLGPQDIVVGKVARLFRLKGHDDLFAISSELVRRDPRIRFLLVGGGEWRQRFEQEALRLGLADRFVFTGLVPPEEVPGLIGIMDVLVHASLREGLARALPQALAAGKPVVAYDCDGASEVCLPEKTGLLVRPGDRDGLREAVLRLSQDANLRERFGSAGRELVRAEFPVQKMVDDIYRLYERLLACNKGRNSSFVRS